MLAVLAPGQGAQTPGFLAPWRPLEGVEDRLRWHSAVVGRDLLALGGDPEVTDLVDTAAVQPLLVAAGLAVAPLLGDLPAGTVFAGHSVGEVTAAVLAGVLDVAGGLAFVRERAAAMADASRTHPGGMVAVLGGDPAEVAAAIAAAGCHVANVNGAGQVVAGGPTDALGALLAAPPQGARLRPLPVAGAFHTPDMAPARATLAPLAAGLRPGDPRHPLLSNADGAVVTSGADMLARLVAQVTAPVRWDRCLDTLAAMGVTAAVELPPAGTLTALLKRAHPQVRAVALRGPDDLPAAAALIADQDAAADAQPDPGWRLLVAPVAGTFHPAPLGTGAELPVGARLGRVESRQETTDVAARDAGVLVEWLAAEGDPVRPGQPLARLHPRAAT